jgi:hypothetical protein
MILGILFLLIALYALATALVPPWRAAPLPRRYSRLPTGPVTRLGIAWFLGAAGVGLCLRELVPQQDISWLSILLLLGFLLILVGEWVDFRRRKTTPILPWTEPANATVICEGRAEVRAVFQVTDAGFVVGCFILSGTLARGATVRLLRNGNILGPPPTQPATVGIIRHHQEELSIVSAGVECGLQLLGLADVRPGDVVEVYRCESQG